MDWTEGFDSVSTLANNKTYLTKHYKYVRYSSNDSVDSGYPFDIKGYWGDIPHSFNNGFDAMATLPNGKTYVTCGCQYVRYSDPNANKVDDGYPLPIKGHWGNIPASFESGFDCMATLPNGKTYVMKGNQYLRYSGSWAETLDAGYPQPIKGNWGNLPDSFNEGFDTISVWPSGKMFITKGDQYVRYSDPTVSIVDAGYPLPIKGHWGVENL